MQIWNLNLWPYFTIDKYADIQEFRDICEASI